MKHAYSCYLSGTGTTRSYQDAFIKALSCDVDVHELSARDPLAIEMGQDELFVLASPVYGGHVPPFVFEKTRNIHGDATPAIALVTYGARDYDNALLEMEAHLKNQGFELVGAAALVARHSIVQSIASNRPDAADLQEVASFAKEIERRISPTEPSAQIPKMNFKGELAKVKPAGLYPEVSTDCIMCGICALECPALAIPQDAPNTTDKTRCISCLRCIEVCPVDARMVPPGVLENLAERLSGLCDPQKKNEFF